MPQGQPIRGYTDQSDHAVAAVNENKELEEEVLRVLDLLADDPNVDLRWLAIGRTHLELGWMSINRAIFRPQRMGKADESRK